MRHYAAALVVFLALLTFITARGQREPFAVFAVELPYHTHITSALTEQAVTMLNNCST